MKTAWEFQVELKKPLLYANERLDHGTTGVTFPNWYAGHTVLAPPLTPVLSLTPKQWQKIETENQWHWKNTDIVKKTVIEKRLK